MNYYKRTTLLQKILKVLQLYLYCLRLKFLRKRSHPAQKHTGVLMVVSKLDRTGGLELQALELSSSLVRQHGCLITILTDSIDHSPKIEFRSGFLIRRVTGSNNPVLSFLEVIWFFYRKRRSFQIVHAHGVTGFTLACLFLSKCFKRTALLKGATRGDFAKIFQQRNWKHRVYRKWILSSDRMIAISQEMKEELLACGIPANKIIRIPNAVRSEKFSPASIERKTSLRKNLSAVIDQFVVLYLGRLEGRKGLDILLKAWQMKSPGALWIVGEGPEREKLKALAADLNLSNVHFYAQTKSPLEFYQAADLFVLPSLREGLPGALLEAMSCGLPCIATQIGGVIDVMEDYKQGLLVPAASVPDLADAIEHATSHPDDRIQWAKQARETILRSFDVSRISSVYLSLYGSLLSETGNSRFR